MISRTPSKFLLSQQRGHGKIQHFTLPWYLAQFKAWRTTVRSCHALLTSTPRRECQLRFYGQSSVWHVQSATRLIMELNMNQHFSNQSHNPFSSPNLEILKKGALCQPVHQDEYQMWVLSCHGYKKGVDLHTLYSLSCKRKQNFLCLFKFIFCP